MTDIDGYGETLIENEGHGETKSEKDRQASREGPIQIERQSNKHITGLAGERY